MEYVIPSHWYLEGRKYFRIKVHFIDGKNQQNKITITK
jgi:hypothetical protein